MAGTSLYDECATDIYNCAAKPGWHFCTSFPELCKGPKFASIDALKPAICPVVSSYCSIAADSNFEPMYEQVCENFDILSDDIKYGTSLYSLKAAGCSDLCKNPLTKDKVCPNGKLTTNFCNLYDGSISGFSDKCTAGTNTFDRCASDWASCLVDP